jgi:hypothetical protein
MSRNSMPSPSVHDGPDRTAEATHRMDVQREGGPPSGDSETGKISIPVTASQDQETGIARL